MNIENPNEKIQPPLPLEDWGEPRLHRRSAKPLAATDISEADRKRLWAGVDIKTKTECWEWKRNKLPSGYGLIWIKDGIKRAHRVAYAASKGDIPALMFVCHSCDNPRCCNPGHLFLGSSQDNVDDCIRKNRHAHGETHGSAKDMSYLRRGDEHHYRAHPELIKFGSKSANAKLKEDDIRKIRVMSAQGQTQKQISEAFGVTESNIGYILMGKTWAHVK